MIYLEVERRPIVFAKTTNRCGMRGHPCPTRRQNEEPERARILAEMGYTKQEVSAALQVPTATLATWERVHGFRFRPNVARRGPVHAPRDEATPFTRRCDGCGGQFVGVLTAPCPHCESH